MNPRITLATAERILRRRSRRYGRHSRMTAYACPFCHCWHMGEGKRSIRERDYHRRRDRRPMGDDEDYMTNAETDAPKLLEVVTRDAVVTAGVTSILTIDTVIVVKGTRVIVRTPIRVRVEADEREPKQ